MIQWGISANSHNAALAVFDNSKLLFASESERFSRVKNDPHLDLSLISYAKNNFGTPDQICWYENPKLKTLRQLVAGQGWLSRENNIKKYLEKYGLDSDIHYCYHHHSHAAAGYFTSRFDNACILVIDAIGEFETLTIWAANGENLKKVFSIWYPSSIGIFYSAMTQRLGLKPNEEEYILMGMAAYGDASRYYKQISDEFVLNYDRFSFRQNLHKGCLWWNLDLPESDYFHVAAATQLVYENFFHSALRKAKQLVDSDNLVLMGGCALNCSANYISHKYYNDVWIMPNPGDAGSSVGAVLALNQEHIKWPGPYLGYNITPETKEEEIVDYLIRYGLCGLARGSAEFGPRAFGHRSLIADPTKQDIKDRVNTIKQRQKFRPFAPMILEEHAADYFDIISNDHRYMQYTVRCKRPDLYPAIVHADMTSRVQTVSKDDCPRVRRLLEIWYEKTGCPMLLNTSLNIKGQPMVNTKSDALSFEKYYNVKVFT